LNLPHRVGFDFWPCPTSVGGKISQPYFGTINFAVSGPTFLKAWAVPRGTLTKSPALALNQNVTT
jgi:hypothetical protein